MNEVGELLRKKREEMSLSLKEIENATSIRTLYLQAIEEGRVNHFLSTVYALGFIRQYATFLGFDLDKLTKEHPEAFRLAPEKQEFAYGIGTLEARTPQQGGSQWMPNLLWGSAVVLFVVVGWFLGKALGWF